MGNALSSQGRYADAEERLREALELVEGDKRLLPRIYVELGTVQLRTSRTAEALVSFEEALKALELNPALRRDPQFVSEIRWTLGNLYYDSRRYTDAASVLREGLPDFPPHLYCHTLITIGNCHFATGKYGAARECYEEVLASDRASGEEKLAAQGAIAGLPPLPPTRVH
jgi:tetratricopeptide (TPR) repeat protein